MNKTSTNYKEPLEGVLAQATAALRNTVPAAGPANELDEKVVQTLERLAAEQSRRLVFWPAGWVRRSAEVLAGMAAVALIAAGVTWLIFAPAPSLAAETFKQGAAAMSDIRSLYIQARVRTRDTENFEHVTSVHDFQHLQIIKDFSDPPRWRMEKPGRVVVMDGQHAILWIPSEKIASRHGPNSGVVEWYRSLLDPKQLLEYEWKEATRQGSAVTMTRGRDAQGQEQIILTVEATAQGDYSQSDYGRNGSIQSSDNRRVYRFDAHDLRLEGLEIYMHTPDGDVLVFQTQQIQYDKEVDPDLFTLKLPEDAIWFEDPTQKLADQPQTPEEMAKLFFDALSREDWPAVQKFIPMTQVPAFIRDFGGLKLISVGEAFKSGLYAGYFVPCEFELRNGERRKCNLAVRNDNPAQRWVWDGGLPDIE
ncbi:MAG: hypothetical protein IT443_07725 [Phycisphaeraceae bacterium]|nr:hypothetical protein [Phycisphaeraceae bacterium]